MTVTIDTEKRYEFLFPGGIYASREETEVQTLLGSCIAVCLHDKVLRVGGINHYMLPLWNGEGLESPRYGNIAIEALLNKLLAMGSSKVNIVAKVFGGASQFENTIINVGERNIQVAESMLERLRIPVRGASLGGALGRKILFNTYSGQVMMKTIERKAF